MDNGRKILLFSYFFPPAGGISCQRMLRFAKYLRDFGWEPVVITTSNTVPWRILDESLVNKTEDIQVLRYASKGINIFYSDEGSFIRKLSRARHAIKAARMLDPMFRWREEVAAALPEIVAAHKPHAALVTAPPFSTLEIIEDIKKVAPELPVIADMRDLLWAFRPYGSIFRKFANRVQRRRAEIIVPQWLAKVDGITVPNKAFIGSVKELSDAPVAAIPTPFDDEDFRDLPEYSRRENFVLLHSGSFHRYNAPEPLFHIFSLLPDDIIARTELRLQGQLSKRARWVFEGQYWAKIFPHVSHRESLAAQCQADVNLVFVTIPAKAGGDQIVPGKVFDYIGAGRPIMAIGPGDGALVSLVRNYNFGTSAPMEKPALAAGMIAKMFRLWENDSLKPVGESREEFCAQNIVHRLADFIDEVAKT